MNLRRTRFLSSWLVWSIAAVFYGYGFGVRIAPGVMVEALMTDWGLSPGDLGDLSGIALYAFALSQLPIATALDRWGARLVLLGGSIMCVVGTIGFSQSTALPVAYLCRVLTGVGAAVGLGASLKLAHSWFSPDRFSYVSGLTLFVGVLGAMMGQAPVAWLERSMGWRNALASVGAFGLVLTVLIAVVVRNRPGAMRSASFEALRLSTKQKLFEVMARKETWFLGLFAFTMTAPLVSFSALWGIPYLAQRYGLSPSASSLILAGLMCGWGVGAPIQGLLSQRLGRRRLPMMVSALATMLGMTAVVMVSMPLPLLFAVLFGTGVASSAVVVAFAAAREHNYPHNSSVVYGLMSTFMPLGALFQSIIGAMLDQFSVVGEENAISAYTLADYELAFLPLIFSLALATVSAVVVRETRCRQVVVATGSYRKGDSAGSLPRVSAGRE